MNEFVEIFLNSFSSYWNYLKSEVLFSYDYKPWYENYFYWFICLFLLVWLLEIVLPWRKDQPIIRKDFWLDAFYMFFNFFILSLIGYEAVSNVAVEFFKRALAHAGITIDVFHAADWPFAVRLTVMFILADLVQWNIHRLLHRVPLFWEFHKVHHSVKQMGFAAQMRFHWAETVIYKSLQYIPLAIMGFGLTDFFIVHIITVLIGNLNHANANIDYGPLKYVLNNPQMHIWHHVKHLPVNHPHGMNFGISLSIWDYLFGTAAIPHDGRDIELGFPGDEQFPGTFIRQEVYPIVR